MRTVCSPSKEFPAGLASSSRSRRSSSYGQRVEQRRLDRVLDDRVAVRRDATDVPFDRRLASSTRAPADPRPEAFRRRRSRRAAGRARGTKPGRRQHREVGLAVGVAGGEQTVAVEDRVGAGEEAEHLSLAAEGAAPGREAHHRAWHENARRRDHAHELEGIDRRRALRAGFRHRDQRVHRHALGMLGQACELDQHRAAIVDRLAHADDAARAHRDARGAHVARACRGGPRRRGS